MAPRNKKQAAALPAAEPMMITADLKFVTEADATALYPDEATMTPTWSMRVNPRLSMWLDPGDGAPVQNIKVAPWKEIVNGEPIKYIVVAKAVASEPGVRRVVREGRSMVFPIALGFLHYPEFVNTGKDNYIFPVRCMKHPQFGNVLAVNISTFETKRVEQRPVKQDANQQQDQPENNDKKNKKDKKTGEKGKNTGQTANQAGSKAVNQTEGQAESPAVTPTSAAPGKVDADK